MHINWKRKSKHIKNNFVIHNWESISTALKERSCKSKPRAKIFHSPEGFLIKKKTICLKLTFARPPSHTHNSNVPRTVYIHTHIHIVRQRTNLVLALLAPFSTSNSPYTPSCLYPCGTTRKSTTVYSACAQLDATLSTTNCTDAILFRTKTCGE